MNERKKWYKRTKFRIFIRVLIAICLAAVIVPSIGLSLFLNRHVSYSGEETKKYPMHGIYNASDYGLTEVIHTITTEDGESIWCSEIRKEKPKGVIIYLSGIIQPSITYFYGHAAWMQENGYASFLLEVRGHGNSSGNQIGFGYKEVADVKSVVEFIKSKEEYKGVPIVIQGVSMGGAIALNAFGQIPEIDGCIAMSPYASCEDELNLLMEKYHVPRGVRAIETMIGKQTLKWIYGEDLVENLCPKKQIQKAEGRPVYIVSCKEDASVPAKNAEILKEAYPKAEVWIRPSWEHFIVKDCDFRHMKNDTEYCEKILSWVESICEK